MLAAPAVVVAFPGRARRAASEPTATLARWRDRLSRRRALRALLREPDSVLADFGLTREAAEAEAARPFWRG